MKNAIGSLSDFDMPVPAGQDPEGEIHVPLASRQAALDIEDLLHQEREALKHPRE
ncbi:MAG: hypothetical protein V1876_04200 [Candidatus Peregrinibacteria bacterium]